MIAQIKWIFSKNKQGDAGIDIIRYWLPELITIGILTSLPSLIDSWIVAKLGSTTTFGALGMGTNFLFTITKLAEAIPVAAINIIGRYNGAGEYEKCGKSLGDAFWTTLVLAFVLFLGVYFGAEHIYRWLQVPEKMVGIGAEFIRIKVIGISLTFTLFAFFGFMRAVKNTLVPMVINIASILIFVVFDAVLVLGLFEFPALGLKGSAYATIIQYATANALAIAYLLLTPEFKKYLPHLFIRSFNAERALNLLEMSGQIIIDKITLAVSYVWLSRMIAGLGKYAIGSYDVVKNLERFAVVPALASAGVVTFLVSNRLGAQDFTGAMANIKKVFFLTCITVVPALCALSFFASFFVGFYDPHAKFGHFAALVLPAISLLAIFDFTQVVLAGALRGAGDVGVVMWTRVFACFGFFIPISYLFSNMPLASAELKFILVYGSFYVTTGLIGVIYLYRIKSHRWYASRVTTK